MDGRACLDDESWGSHEVSLAPQDFLGGGAEVEVDGMGASRGVVGGVVSSTLKAVEVSERVWPVRASAGAKVDGRDRFTVDEDEPSECEDGLSQVLGRLHDVDGHTVSHQHFYCESS